MDENSSVEPGGVNPGSDPAGDGGDSGGFLGAPDDRARYPGQPHGSAGQDACSIE